MTQSSKTESVSDVGGGDPAVYLDKVYDMHRRSYHYNIKTLQEKIYIMNLAEVQKYGILAVEKAFQIYKEKRNEDGKRAHPNYFMAVLRRIAKDFKPEPKVVWGKTI